MFQSDAKTAGHQKAAPLLAVSGTAKSRTPSGHHESRAVIGGVRWHGTFTVCASRAHTRAQNTNTHVSNGLPDTTSKYKALRCPALKYQPDTPDTEADTLMSVEKMTCSPENGDAFKARLREELPEAWDFAKALHKAGMLDGLRGSRIVPAGDDSGGVAPTLSDAAESRLADKGKVNGR